jgi:hypothetical protein
MVATAAYPNLPRRTARAQPAPDTAQRDVLLDRPDGRLGAQRLEQPQRRTDLGHGVGRRRSRQAAQQQGNAERQHQRNNDQRLEWNLPAEAADECHLQQPPRQPHGACSGSSS